MNVKLELESQKALKSVSILEHELLRTSEVLCVRIKKTEGTVQKLYLKGRNE